MDSPHSSHNVPRGPSGAEPDVGDDSHVLARDDARPAGEAVAGPEQTVISTGPPLPLRPLAEGLHPRDLGRALEGQQLGGVLLEEFVGGGGMGAVFRALDTKLHRTVAVKVLSTYQTGDAETERRFQMEARSAARLDHPNIARVYNVGEDRGVRYIVFEYIGGTNVRDLVRTYGPFTLADSLRYTLQIADALVHAWQRDVVHRDIKPSNILITPEGQAKLVDMGLARYEQVDQADQEQTATGVTLGTFDYISPEQARDPRDADTRSDIYSLGCTLFFMLAGRPPFPDGTMLQKVLQHQADPPPDVRPLRPDVPEPVVELMETMLAKKAEDRFQNPAELVAVLASCSDQLGIAHVQLALSADWPFGALRPAQWRRHALWVVPCVLLVLGVAGLEWALGRGQAPPQFPELRIPPPVEPATSDQAAPADEPPSAPIARTEEPSGGIAAPAADVPAHSAGLSPPFGAEPAANAE